MTRRLVVAFDGACEPKNPGGIASWGYVILEERRELQARRGVVGEGDGMTNNVAEYAGLIEAIGNVTHMVTSGDSVRIQGDSQLVIRQLKGDYRVRSERLRPLHAQLSGLIDDLKRIGVKIEIDWVPREENERADTLSHEAFLEFLAKKR
jgi:ribonuclease HI